MKIFSDDANILEKYNRFKEMKALENHPLVRFCVKPGCKGYV
jgi:hypothetical protein